MKFKILFFVFFILGFLASSQRKSNRYEFINLGIGYSYSFADPHDKNFHLLELGLNKSRYDFAIGGGFQYGVGASFLLNGEKFTIGPKISAQLYFTIFVLGTEFIYFTDFQDATFRFSPFFGIGYSFFQLTLNPHIILMNKNYQPIDRGLVNLSFNIPLRKKKID